MVYIKFYFKAKLTVRYPRTVLVISDTSIINSCVKLTPTKVLVSRPARNKAKLSYSHLTVFRPDMYGITSNILDGHASGGGGGAMETYHFCVLIHDHGSMFFYLQA